jgi:hypothetical protein
MKSFLCALDFTEGTSKFLKAATQLAAKQDARLTILYPYRLLLAGADHDAVGAKKKIVTGAVNKFSELEKKLHMTGKLPYTFEPEIGFLSDQIQRRIKRQEVDTIVLSQRQSVQIDEHTGLTIQQLLDGLKVNLVIIDE